MISHASSIVATLSSPDHQDTFLGPLYFFLSRHDNGMHGQFNEDNNETAIMSLARVIGRGTPLTQFCHHHHATIIIGLLIITGWLDFLQ
jgi:hypothetical protein